jgi:2-dehydro-3-deoxyphosphogluconate aldolase/(4S)-4-hydroxy-2-oxoglutarate aldolase
MTAMSIFAEHRCSAILRTGLPRAVRPALDAALAGGFRIVEVTLNTPQALEEIARLARDSSLLVGAGTVLTVEEANRAAEAGARFLVSPVTDVEVIGWCRENDVLCIPGAFTPTEMLLAHRTGADLVKLFPAPPGGPDYVRSCRGPLPHIKLFPTAGVTEDNVAAYFAAGVFGVGFAAALFVPDDLEHGRFAAIEARARRQVEATRSATRT